MIQAFLGIACNYGGLHSERSPFLSPLSYEGAIRALVRNGYAERVGDQYRWTEQIGPAMRASYLWNEEFLSYPALWRDEETAEAEVAWRTMPDTIRQTYFSSRPVDLMAFIRVLALSWKNGQWHSFKGADRVTLSRQVDLAKRIVRYADEGR